MATLGYSKLTCPLCDKDHFLRAWRPARLSVTCCNVYVRGRAGQYGKAHFKIGKYEIVGNRERTRIDLGHEGNHQVVYHEVRHFVGLSEEILDKIYLSGKWDLIHRIGAMK